jgi:hypothetical protein
MVRGEINAAASAWRSLAAARHQRGAGGGMAAISAYQLSARRWRIIMAAAAAGGLVTAWLRTY